MSGRVLQMSGPAAVCGLCSSPDVRDLFVIKGTQLKKCGNCGAAFVYPLPDSAELISEYQDDYFASRDHLEWGYENYFSLEGDVRETARRRLKLMSRYIRDGKLLEGGAATGWFLDEARRQGFQVQGAEVSGFAAKWGEDNLRVPIFNGTLREAAFADGEFDVVVLWDVLEHLTEPLEELYEIHRVLKPGGYLFVSVPDYGSIWARALGRRWFGFTKIREHVYYYNRHALAGVMGRAGLKVVKAQSSPFLVNLDFFVSKIAQYSSPAAKALARVLAKLRLQNRKIQLLKVDLLMVARKETSPAQPRRFPRL